jgi:hypothetical protein
MKLHASLNGIIKNNDENAYVYGIFLCMPTTSVDDDKGILLIIKTFVR